MSSLSSLTKAVSGLAAAQKGLQVTGHNISNANTKGYTRQQLLQSESAYLTIGKNGGYAMQVGLGVTQDEIRQIRDDLADKRLRTENSVLCYYQKLNTTMTDVEAVFDEPYGDTISDFLNQFWSQAQKLNTNPAGVEERQSFISSAKVLIDKINDVSKGLTDYQNQLNNDVITATDKVNQILKDIRIYNEKVCLAEADGDLANDYRDERNLLLDELSTYGDIRYFEEADGQIQVTFEGHIVINKAFEIKIELKDIENSAYKTLTWSDSKEEVFDLSKVSSAGTSNDSGALKALLIARGRKVAIENKNWDDIALDPSKSVDATGNAYVIPKIQKMLEAFTTQLVKVVNESFTGTGIGTHKGKEGAQIFVSITGSEKDPLVLGNIQVNQELLEGGGYNKLGTVKMVDGDSGSNVDNSSDNTLISQFLKEWNTARNWFGEDNGLTSPYEKVTTLTSFFSELVTEIGSESSTYKTKAAEKSTSVTNIENERRAMGGVSTDEEFSNMLKYQYAYNASARMITMLDGMLDTVINQL